MDRVRWEHFEHGADIGVRGIAPTLSGAFEQAALAMTAAMVDPRSVRPEQEIEITCQASAPDILLVEWLNAIVYEMALRRMIFGKFKVHLDGGSLSAKAWGEAIDRDRHEPAAEVKGATYTALGVTKNPDGNWIAQCIVDV